MKALSFLVLALCLCSNVAGAQVQKRIPVYRCTSTNGSITYTNVPSPGCVVAFLYTPKSRPASAVQGTSPSTTDSHLIEQGSYVNHDGITVHRPAHTVSGLPPPHASAQCVDGSFSFSTHRSGTCSHHGGVIRWLSMTYAAGSPSACEGDHWVDSVEDDGKVVILEDGSAWEIDDGDTADTSTWISQTELIICGTKLIDTDDDETVDATRVR